MKFYSEKLDKLFDSMEELNAAEASTKKAKKISSKTLETSVPTKKQLANEVEAADAKVKEAYANYEAAKTKAEEISKKYLAELNSILEPAEVAVKEAEKVRYEAIRKFNDSYGAYQVTYTGARAADELTKAIKSINSRANKMFGDIFWI